MITLHGRATDKITLEKALGACVPAFSPSATALLYTPKEFLFGQLNANGQLTDAKGNQIRLDDVFEARIFDENVELRWRNDSLGLGRAVLLSENNISAYLEDQGLDLDTSKILSQGERQRTIPQTYLLWGQGVDAQKVQGLAPGWSRLTMARIGKLDVPLQPVKEKERVQLHVLEYLNVVDDHGNIAVVEERLLKLAIAQQEDTNG